MNVYAKVRETVLENSMKQLKDQQKNASGGSMQNVQGILSSPLVVRKLFTELQQFTKITNSQAIVFINTEWYFIEQSCLSHIHQFNNTCFSETKVSKWSKSIEEASTCTGKEGKQNVIKGISNS